MAKKRSADGFNMSEAIRELLTENKALSSREVYEELQKRHPGREINHNSSNVAYSMAKKRLGIKGGRRKSVRMRKPQAAAATARSSGGEALDFNLLKLARRFISEAGGSQKALAAIQQVEALQIQS